METREDYIDQLYRIQKDLNLGSLEEAALEVLRFYNAFEPYFVEFCEKFLGDEVT